MSDDVITEHSQLPNFLTNTYLVADREGGTGFFVDAGGPVAPLVERAQELGLKVSHVLLTHHHYDHVCDLPALTEAFPKAEVLIDEREEQLVDDRFRDCITGHMHPDETLRIGDLDVHVLHTPGHTLGMLSLHVENEVFTGDTLFKNSVGGVRAPGSTSFEDIKSSIMDTLLELPPETVVRPGHAEPSTVGEEWEGNSFVRIWRGLDKEGDEPCSAFDDAATLVHLGDDYDGGHKAWVRWPDGSDDIVPGSQVERI